MKKIDNDVLDVLNRSRIDGKSLMLPEQLERALYVKTAKIIELAGGKWNKKAKAHLFDSCPKAKLGLAVESGEILDAKKEFQAFYTPLSVVDELMMIAGIGPNMRVLEPSAGIGNIAIKARDLGAEVECCELNAEARQVLLDKGFCIQAENFLDYEPVECYDVVVGNPPFNKGQEVEHTLHAFKFLKPGGKLVFIVSPSYQHNTRKPYPEFAKFIQKYGSVIRELPEGTFKEAGTNIRTCVIKLIKPL